MTVTVPATSWAARDFFCPVCGLQNYGNSGRRECAHLVFGYIEESGAFDFCFPQVDLAGIRADLDRAERFPAGADGMLQIRASQESGRFESDFRRLPVA